MRERYEKGGMGYGHAKQAVFERYQLVPGWLRRTLLEPMIMALPSLRLGAPMLMTACHPCSN